jgi:hypothetical protein
MFFALKGQYIIARGETPGMKIGKRKPSAGKYS